MEHVWNSLKQGTTWLEQVEAGVKQTVFGWIKVEHKWNYVEGGMGQNWVEQGWGHVEQGWNHMFQPCSIYVPLCSFLPCSTLFQCVPPCSSMFDLVPPYSTFRPVPPVPQPVPCSALSSEGSGRISDMF